MKDMSNVAGSLGHEQAFAVTIDLRHMLWNSMSKKPISWPWNKVSNQLWLSSCQMVIVKQVRKMNHVF
jgi:hypothetical protein